MENTRIAQDFYINPTYIVSLPQWDRSGSKRSSAQIRNESNLKENNPNGQISRKAAKNIRNAINWMYASAKRKRVYSEKTGKNYYFKLNFITLTLCAPQGDMSDQYFKNVMLRKFINTLRATDGLRNYFWRVEPQKHGNIHAHFVTDTFIHKARLSKVWNRIQAKEGLIDQFEAKHGHREPPSTNVKAIRNEKDLGAYMADYVGKKQEGRREIKGKLWATSYNLSANNKCTYESDPNECARLMRDLERADVEWKPILSKPDAMGDTMQLGEIFFMKPSTWCHMPRNSLREEYDNHRFHIRHNLQKVPIETLIPQSNGTTCTVPF